jgi:KUP system potassium uptake protein
MGSATSHSISASLRRPVCLQRFAWSREAVGFAPEEASYFLDNEVPAPSLQPELPRWQEQILSFLTRNAVRAPDYFLIPPPRVVELGTRVEL